MSDEKEKKELIPVEQMVIEQLTKRTDPIFVEQTQLRGGIFNTIEIGYVEFVLNFSFKFWDFEIVDDKQIDGHIVVKGKLTIKDNQGNIKMVKMQYGSSEVKKFKEGGVIDLANDYKSAASDCLKKCASLLGIAFDVYHPKVYAKILSLAAAKKQKEIIKNRPALQDKPVVEKPDLQEKQPQTEGMKKAKEKMNEFLERNKQNA